MSYKHLEPEDRVVLQNVLQRERAAQRALAQWSAWPARAPGLLPCRSDNLALPQRGMPSLRGFLWTCHRLHPMTHGIM